ncbi:MAG: kynureninase [Myxococcales bacterium]|nr:kynureninase [Myxococcales bacterium]
METSEFELVPEQLRNHYRRFRVSERILLSGHSHQAWPDCAFDAQTQAWLDAAAFVDDKWRLAFEKAGRVAKGFADLLGDQPENIALGANTHELVFRFLSALPLRERPKVVTTDHEFHSMWRQLARLAEEGLEIDWVSVEPVETLCDRLIATIDHRTAAVMVSAVFFDTAKINPNLGVVCNFARSVGAEMFVDAYHALGVVDYDLSKHGLNDAYVTGGGYKYLQLGEGNCFLRLPPHCELRPIFTGWFADFEHRSNLNRNERVAYGDGGIRFAGATYDPTSHYRGAAVFEFFERQKLTPSVLRTTSQRQLALFEQTLVQADLPTSVFARTHNAPLPQIGGFLTYRSAQAPQVVAELRRRNIFCDARGTVVRFGPAPYLSDQQIQDGALQTAEVVRSLPRSE